MLKPIKGKIKLTGEVVELEPITNEEIRKKYVWMEKVSGVFYKESDIEIIHEEVNECVCEKLKRVKGSETHLEDDCYTALVMGYGWIAAYGEGCAQTDIQYCPFCGKNLNKMAKERKYLDEFEMNLLEKYGIKILKKI